MRRRTTIFAATCAALLTTSSLAVAGPVAVESEGTLPVLVNPMGTVVRFDGSIQLVTARRFYSAEKLPSGDLEIKPASPNAPKETVTVVVVGGRSVTLELSASQNADTFKRIAFRSETNRKEPQHVSFFRSILKGELPAYKLGGSNRQYEGLVLKPSASFQGAGFRALQFSVECTSPECTFHPGRVNVAAARPLLGYATSYQFKKSDKALFYVVLESPLTPEALEATVVFGGAK